MCGTDESPSCHARVSIAIGVRISCSLCTSAQSARSRSLDGRGACRFAKGVCDTDMLDCDLRRRKHWSPDGRRCGHRPTREDCWRIVGKCHDRWSRHAWTNHGRTRCTRCTMCQDGDRVIACGWVGCRVRCPAACGSERVIHRADCGQLACARVQQCVRRSVRW